MDCETGRTGPLDNEAPSCWKAHAAGQVYKYRRFRWANLVLPQSWQIFDLLFEWDSRGSEMADVCSFGQNICQYIFSTLRCSRCTQNWCVMNMTDWQNDSNWPSARIRGSLYSVILFNDCFKAKWKFTSREQSAGQNLSINKWNKSLENVEHFKY
jgi:hypothetical protein